MPVRGTYLDMPLSIDDLDGENLEYFRHCAAHDFHLQQCDDCKLLRYPPTTACPWCTCLTSTWTKVEGKGAVYSYEEVHHGIQPAFQARTPYMVLLVELDTQKGKPTEHEVAARHRQPDDAGRPAGTARHGEEHRHRLAHADGVQRCGARTVAAAMDDRRGRAAAGQAVALSAGVTSYLTASRNVVRLSLVIALRFSEAPVAGRTPPAEERLAKIGCNVGWPALS